MNVFAWTYKDLRSIPPNVCQHQIILKANIKLVTRQKQYQMDPKYSPMMKEGIDKLLECPLIYLIHHSESVLPIVVVPKKMVNLEIAKIFVSLIISQIMIISLYHFQMPS